MTLFLLSIGCVVLELSDAVDSIHRLSLSIYWRFQVWQGLCFRWRFMHQQWHSISDNSMRQPWLYFFYRFMRRSWINWLCWLHMSALTQYSLMISRSIVTVFTADLWISRDIAFLTIPCIGHDSIFAIDWMCRSWINWRCRLNTSAVTQHSIKISRSTVTLFSPPICGSAVT